MILKLKLYRNNVKAEITDDLSKLVSYFKSHNIDLVIDQEETKVKLPEVNVRVNLALPNDGKYDIVAYLYDRLEQRPNGHGLAENFSVKTKLFFVPTGKLEDVDGYHFNIMAHEIMHCLFMKLNLRQYDPMDTYEEDNNPYSLTGNFSKAWKVLEKYIAPPIKTVAITRLEDNGYQTTGKLKMEGLTCDTLERPWSNNLPNVSCIPKGTYKVSYSWSWKFMKNTYRLEAVPKRSGILIHSGNYFFDIQGCIILGQGYKDINGDGKVDILNSRVTIKKFEDLLQRKPFLLNIL